MAFREALSHVSFEGGAVRVDADDGAVFAASEGSRAGAGTERDARLNEPAGEVDKVAHVW